METRIFSPLSSGGLIQSSHKYNQPTRRLAFYRKPIGLTKLMLITSWLGSHAQPRLEMIWLISTGIPQAMGPPYLVCIQSNPIDKVFLQWGDIRRAIAARIPGMATQPTSYLLFLKCACFCLSGYLQYSKYSR